MRSPMDNRELRATADSDRRRLLVVLGVTSVYLVTELVGGYLTGSLALLSDAVHMLTDIAALCLGLLTLWISTRPASSAKTYGYLRAEILGALLNGLFLWLLVAFIWIEAVGRLRNPRPVSGLGVMAVAIVGIGVNTFSAWMTSTDTPGGPRRGMPIRAVCGHVISDLVGSVGVLASGALINYTAGNEADPAVSILIGCLVLYGSWGLVREGVDILMESVPSHIDLDEMRNDLLASVGVASTLC